MIHIGDVVQSPKTKRKYTVLTMNKGIAGCGSPDSEQIDVTVPLDRQTQDIADDSSAILVSCPHTTPYPAQAVRNADANLSYAKAVGSMESRLAMVYNTIVRAITLNDVKHTASVAWNLNWIRERIESTADHVASIATPSGVPSLTYLRDEISRQRSNFTTDTPEEN